MKTYTPGLSPAILDHLRDYAVRRADDFPQSNLAPWAEVSGVLVTDDRGRMLKPGEALVRKRA